MKISISGSIVIYKSDSSAEHAITSFLNTSIPVKLFIVDNSPKDNFRREFGHLLQDSRVQYIFNNKNIGFGPAHNIAMRKAVDVADYHLVLNPDVTFGENVLETIYTYMQANPDVGLLMPKVLYPDNRLQRICKLLPTPSDLILRRFLPESFLKKRLDRYDLSFSGYNQIMEVPNLSGCFMFMRTTLLPKTGYFDENFFLYLEDTDLSRRFFKVAKNIYFPFVHIYHDHERGSYKNLKLLFIHSRSALKYFNKWGWWHDKERDEINHHVLDLLQNRKIPQNSFKVKTA